MDGKCECGAIDPNHTHNYVDGTCTICGKEQEPYETAPASAYSNWNYTLDDENGIITLNYYTGSETNVIVYANYPVDGKTYKTQIASNVDKTNASTPAIYQFPYMFNGWATHNCRNIRSIKFSRNIDTSNVTDMRAMFYECSALTSLDISNFDTSNVTNMYYMFNSCENLSALDLSHFDTSKVTNMNSMFCFNYKLSNLNLSSFDTSNVTNMERMFCQCKALTNLDLSGFDTNQATNMSSMFSNCLSLKTIYVTEGKWSTSQANISSMFSSCGTSSVTYMD